MMALAFTAAQAQDTYTNDRLTNTSDINGTARYVGMGGAMGALGADISVISNNPAGIGLFRRNDISIGMGAVVQDAPAVDGESRAHYSFDQVGFVASFSGRNNNHINFALNLQKKLDFRRSMIAENGNLGGLSQAAQLAGLMADFYDSYSENVGSLVNQAYAAGLYDILFAGNGEQLQYKANQNSFYRNSSGNLYGLDLNVSGGVNNRFFWGLTFGVDFLNYNSDFSYVEFRDGYFNREFLQDFAVQDYTIEGTHNVSGAGFNVKLGTIIRPSEDSPFRIGLAFETPTWYTLRQEDNWFYICSKWQYNGWNAEAEPASYDYTYIEQQGQYQRYDSPDASYLEFNLHSPWKFRASIGSTVEDYLAWDIEYEYALNNRATMGYPRYESNGWDDQSVGMDSDKSMNALTEKVMNGVHNFRAGLEYKPVDAFAVRLGYNFYSKPMKDDGRYDQSIDSYYMNYVLGTDYMNLKGTNIFSLGMGYRYKNFYADVAYKYRHQKGDFYAFDDFYQTSLQPEDQFITEGQYLNPTSVNLDRHNVTFTLGYKF